MTDHDKLSPRCLEALDAVNKLGECRIQEVADEMKCSYANACSLLLRLEATGHVTKERLYGAGTNSVLYRKLVLANPDSDDPLEKMFAAPAAEVPHG